MTATRVLLVAIVLALAGGCNRGQQIMDAFTILFPTPQEDCEREGGVFTEVIERETGKPESIRYECRK